MECNIVEKLEKDEVFNKFLHDSFDAKAHANEAIQQTLISEHLAKLADGISILDREIHTQIDTHHEDLLSTATGVETLEGVLQMMQTRIQSLMVAMDRIRSKVAEPYSKMKTETCKLRRLQETCDLLRKIIRIMYLSKKLRTQLDGGSRELTKAAQSLNELDFVCEGVNLVGIDVIEQDRRFIKQAHKEVEVQAKKMLDQGMELQNQIQVATALQVFYNLGNLDVMVERSLASCKDALYEKIRSSLDTKSLSQQLPVKGGPPGRSTMPAPGNTAVFRANLWTNLNNLMDTIYSLCSQVQHLQKVLTKKHDPVTQVCFIDELSKNKDDRVNIMASFWLSVTTLLGSEFSEAAAGSTFLKQTFDGEYPKLLRLYNDLWGRLQQFAVTSLPAAATDEIPRDADNLFGSKSPAITDPELALRSTLQQFETAYLSRSLSRLFDPINLIFSNSSTMPTTEEVDNLIKIITSELNVATVDPSLLTLIAKNIAKTVQLFCVKTEQILCTEGDSTQVIGPATPAQTHNVTIVNTLYYFVTSLNKAFSSQNLSQFARIILDEAAKGVSVLMGAAIQPLLSSVADALDAILLTMHQEDFSDPAPRGDIKHSQCSLYMRELQEFTSRAYTTYFQPFTCNDFIMDSLLPLASRCAELFVRHASLIRPLGDGGKLRLAADFAQAEMAISPLCRRVSDIGRHYKTLRALRPLLFQSSDHLCESPTVGEIIPHSVVLHFLFSRAPSDLKSPHQLSNWSVSRYSQWLDDHASQHDQLALINGALETYVQLVKSRESKEFAPIYPVMLAILQRGIQKTTTNQ